MELQRIEQFKLRSIWLQVTPTWKQYQSSIEVVLK